MLNSKEEIRIEQAVVHIMDPGLGMPVLSDTLLDLGSDLADFLKAHIYKIDTSDDVKNCSFFPWWKSGNRRNSWRLPKRSQASFILL